MAEAAEQARRTPWQAWGFLALAMVLNLAIGSASSYSYWKIGFYKHFTPCRKGRALRDDDVDAAAILADQEGERCWDHHSLSSLYSWCIFGGFICITPGILFDKFGPRVTAAYGLLLVNVGIGGMLALLTMGGTPSIALVGFFYLLEEQGGAASLYMVAVCVLVRAFPSDLVGVASGGVAVAFGLSGLLWTALAGELFGFVDGADPDDTNITGFLALVLLATDVSGIAIFCAAPRVLALLEGGDDSPEGKQPLASDEADKSSAPPISRSICTWDCLCLMALYSVASSQVIGMSSYLSSIPTAFGTVNTGVFATIPFAANVGGRVVYAVLVDCLARCGGRPAITLGNLWINGLYALCFGLLAAAARAGQAPSWLLYAAVGMAYSAYGGSVCFASSFTKLSFFPAHIGILIGLLFTVAAVASTLFSAFFFVGNSLGSGGLERVPSDFTGTWSAACASALCAFPVTLLVAVKAQCGARSENYVAGRELGYEEVLHEPTF